MSPSDIDIPTDIANTLVDPVAHADGRIHGTYDWLRAHVCLGQHLARQEMKALFERLLPTIRSVALAGDTEMSQSFFVNGLKRLPIRFELEAG